MQILTAMKASEGLAMKLVARDDGDQGGFAGDDWGSSSWVWGRWILFVIFVVFLLLTLFWTSRVNKRRQRMGVAPIRGTSWLMPPSYRQSQREHNPGTTAQAEDYVPKYTQEANEEDLGYYDERGEFHANDKAEYLPPPALVNEVGTERSSSNSANLERPRRAATRLSSAPNTPAAPAESEFDASFDRDFRRYDYLNSESTNNTAQLHTPSVSHHGSVEEVLEELQTTPKEKQTTLIREIPSSE